MLFETVAFPRRLALAQSRPEPRVAPPPSDTSSERFRALLAAHFDFAWRTLRRLGVAPADVDDAAQEVSVVLARRLADVQPGRERAFIFATCVRVTATRRRSERRRLELAVAELEHVESAELSPDELTGLARARPLLQRILEEMSDEFRSVFVLAELEELSVPEIADLLDIPIGTVSSRLRTARERFRASIARLARREDFKGRLR